DWRGDQSQRRVVFSGLQAAAAPQFPPVVEIVGDSVICTMRNEKRLLAVVVNGRRGVTMLNFAAAFAEALLSANLLSGRLVEAHDDGFLRLDPVITVDQLQIQPFAVQDRRGGHSECNVEFSVAILKVELPSFIPVKVVTGEDAGSYEGPHKLSVR